MVGSAASSSNPPDTKATAPSTQTQIVIRALQERDIEHLGESEQMHEFFLKAVPRVDWSEKKLRVFVAEFVETGQLTGRVMVGLGYPDYFPKLDDNTVGQMYLSGINVKPEFQRRGIGLQLLQFLEREAEILNLDVFRAECEKGFLVDFYGKIGLEPVPYRGTHGAYPESHQMLELWLKKITSGNKQSE